MQPTSIHPTPSSLTPYPPQSHPCFILDTHSAPLAHRATAPFFPPAKATPIFQRSQPLNAPNRLSLLRHPPTPPSPSPHKTCQTRPIPTSTSAPQALIASQRKSTPPCLNTLFAANVLNSAQHSCTSALLHCNSLSSPLSPVKGSCPATSIHPSIHPLRSQSTPLYCTALHCTALYPLTAWNAQ